jgi:acyl-CoA synthetase (AMP-forming)/AMP-acid ligase II
VVETVETLVEALEHAPQERTFVSMSHAAGDPDILTFGEFRRSSEAFASFFREHQVALGDRVILVLPQGPTLMSAFVGAMMLGAIPAILPYPIHKMEPVKYRKGLSGVSQRLSARLVLVDAAFPPALRDVLSSTPGLTIVEIDRRVIERPGFRPVQRHVNDIAFIQHSAGTTGLQKGVSLTHGAVLRQIAHLRTAIDLRNDDRLYSWLPLYHDMGLIACFMLPMACHVPVIMQDPLEWVMQPTSMLETIARERCTIAWLPNFAFQFAARRASEPGYGDLSGVRALINCSEPVRASSLDEFYAAFASSGIRREALQTSYAMAENVFAVTQSRAGELPARVWADSERFLRGHVIECVPEGAPGSLCFVSSGRMLPNHHVGIHDDNGEILPEGRVGEIWITSDCLFQGYFSNAEATAVALIDGCYHTGDLGFLWRGELFVVGRARDLIIVAGKNIYPQDVEELAGEHPRVHDGRCVALGIVNADVGTEEIVIVVEVDDEDDLAASAEIARQVRQSVNAELGVSVRDVYVKPPRWIVKSTAGKPARTETRERLLKEHPALAERGSVGRG